MFKQFEAFCQQFLLWMSSYKNTAHSVFYTHCEKKKFLYASKLFFYQNIWTHKKMDMTLLKYKHCYCGWFKSQNNLLEPAKKIILESMDKLTTTTTAGNENNILGKRMSPNFSQTCLLTVKWRIWGIFLLIFWLQFRGGGRMIQSRKALRDAFSSFISCPAYSLHFNLPSRWSCFIMERSGVNVTCILCGCRASDCQRKSPTVH